MRLRAVTYFVLICSMASVTASAGTWHADPINGCTIFDDEGDASDVLISWSGDCDADNHASGGGVLSWIEAGDLVGRYDGEMRAGKAHGEGVLQVAAEGGGFDRIEGRFEDSEVAGPVRIDAADGTVFIGELDSVEMTGSGILTTPEGDQYTGAIRNARMNGDGHLVLADGEQYRGTFEDNELKGVGEWLGNNGDYYKGTFRDGEFSGTGRFEAADGAVYEGLFSGGLPEGEGRLTDADGRVTAGEFRAGWPDGRVTVTMPDGATVTERWADGQKKEN